MHEPRSYCCWKNQHHRRNLCWRYQQLCRTHQLEDYGRDNAQVFRCIVRLTPFSQSFTLVTLTFLVILTNSALFNLRARASQHDTSAPAAPAFWPPHGQFMPQLPANIPHAPIVHAQGEGGEGEARQIGWGGEKGKHGW